MPLIKRYAGKLKKSIKRNGIGFAAAAIIIILVGFTVLPSIGKCITNGSENKCSSKMYLLISQLSEHLADEPQGGEWHDMILNGKSDEALEILAQEVLEKKVWKIDSGDYYFEKSGGELVLRCVKHKNITDRTILISGAEDSGEKDLGTLGWNSNTNREIKDVKSLGNDALILDAGVAGKYCLAAWPWQDFVEEAKASTESDTVFDASIMLYDGIYYYYPDGFRIRKDAQNTNPFKYAEDLFDSKEGAYCIPFDTNSVSTSRFSQNNHEGSLMVEEDGIFIWQTQPSRELSKGWIKVYCQYKKL
ncbi:MAG: hypothetical protein LIO59_06460 [Oscillospiraceae bacterium]|nr:hypothetical protein [Oscillospiraceae bacterium]